ncbi:MAG TPA: sigma-54 dependent transcriptional regulator, partial [Vicinamibacteria bacterium]|nr:sigma-54 dependent transcriptional regulator [Vicinamibacteria bacterium]
MSQEEILVVDDEEVMRDVLGRVIGQAGYAVSFAETGPQGLELARRGNFAAAIVDVMLPEMGGLEVLEELKKVDPEMVVLMITAFASMEMAIEAIKKGAFYFVPKPFDNQQLLHILARGLLQRRLEGENRELRTALRDQGRFMELVGKSPKMLQVFQLVSQVAPSRSTILVVGESGTGKELVAKAIHQNSPRRDRPFVVVNSGSLPHELLESNLFGHVKGAFTGAVYAKKGLFELADKGTLFFDEIGNIPIETQAKLLRVMQEREFMRLGGVETVKVDVRVVAATNIDLRRAVEEGRFREDLYYRLNVIAIQLPPLRQRKEDIPALTQHFVDKYARENGKVVEEVSPEAMQVLLDYDWPGNVRELENVIER